MVWSLSYAKCFQFHCEKILHNTVKGASTFLGLKKFIADRSHTRLLAFLHIASHGLAAAGCSGGASGGESESLHVVDIDDCVRCIEENRDVLVGVKVRLSKEVTNKGQHEAEVFRRALEASSRAQVPLMTHHSSSSIPVQRSNSEDLGCPGSLRPGDIYTHTYHGFPSSIIDPSSQAVWSDVWEARRRGVLFDVGHGQGSFSWPVAELAAKEGFWPDIISTDLHTGNFKGPAYDLPTVMTKFLAIGMPLEDVVRATTCTPAKAIGRAHDIGSLAIGHVADITALKLEDCDVALEDCHGQQRRVKRNLYPVSVWRAGKQFHTIKSFPWHSALKETPNQ
ncbi:deacetylase Atu3266-like isoform X2 [Liolophura sinensis]|uniref:deacetylase Atu3266-like isoform X2 n=1 Tax=Liolophura sinensis TaxID=3198878 RepID=UPI003158DB15